MSVKKWMWIFVASALLVALLFVCFNALVDPFGIFGDRALAFWSYNMTQNPRTAKIGWLDERHSEYDAYIIGCSKTSSLPTERLNEYYGANFYNMIMYGGDLYDSEMTVQYILENYGARHIVVNTGLSELLYFNGEDDDMKGNLHAKVDGSNPLLFYGKYLLSHPQYSIDKLKAFLKGGYLVTPDKVFVPETGAYDKSLRDIEPIGNLENYLNRYPEFTKQNEPLASLPAVDECVASIARMKRMCEEAGATFTFIVSPMYNIDLDIYSGGDLFDFFRKLANVTDFWDFSGYHSVAFEARYFYDTTHYRNNVGAMMLARMFGDDRPYLPEDFGVRVTADTVEARIASYRAADANILDNDVELPVLMYHNVSEGVQNAYNISPDLFRGQMEALKDAGYTAVTFAQVVDYVETGAPLPEKPIVITFDDGYAENLTLAAPILRDLGMCAEINVIGVSIGKDTYKDTGVSMIPHFPLADALPWVGAGVIEIGSHSYDMHQVAEYDGDDCRRGVTRMEGESEDAYIAAFREDFARSSGDIARALGEGPIVYAYPYGYHSDLTEVLLSEQGIQVTLTVDEGMNTVVAGLPQSLRALKRCNISDEMSPEELVGYLKGLRLND